MQYSFDSRDGFIRLTLADVVMAQNYYVDQSNGTHYAILWNKGESIQIKIDTVWYQFPSQSVLPIMHDQCYEMTNSKDIVVWQFNSEFYCIVNHDAEVGCVGFIFYGPYSNMFIHLDEVDVDMMHKLLLVFEEEFKSKEEIKETMLRMLLVRLIIKITRLAKKQYLNSQEVEEEKFNLIRKFHLLVEQHYKSAHQVTFYADLLHKSPKTISNYFALFSKKTPQQVIHERIITEAKRLLFYTEKSIKEISHDLGFSEVTHFSKFFKNNTSQSPSTLRNNNFY